MTRNYEDRVTSKTSIVIDDRKDVVPQEKPKTVFNEIVNPIKDKFKESS